MSATAATKAAPAKAKPSMKYVQLKREKNNFVPPKPSQINREESARSRDFWGIPMPDIPGAVGGVAAPSSSLLSPREVS